MNSVWTKTAKLPTFKSLKNDIKTDVLIIGGGITGILCAYMLQQAGVNYVLIEADRICGGVSENTTAKITSQHGFIYDKLIKQFGVEKAQMYLKANQQALKQYRKMCKTIDCDFEVKDSFVYSTEQSDKLEKELNALNKISANAEFVKGIPLPVTTVGAIKFKNQAQFNPLKFIASVSSGLNIYEQTKALQFDGKTVVTSGGKIKASKIIVATQFPIFNKHGSYFLKMYQHRSYVLALSLDNTLDGMYVDQSKSGLSFRNFKNYLLLGGGSHRTGEQGGSFLELQNFADINYPNAKIEYRWATQDCMTLDGVPYIGQYSKRTPNLFVATGFNKWGITSSMAAAQILCDEMLGKENEYAPVFSPSRTILRPQLILNAFKTTANLLTPTKPRCPHLGCALKWNQAEHTWDCPCHGSRFSKDGKLLDNPATSDLNKKAH